MHACVGAKSLQSCLTLCDPMYCSPPVSSVHEDSPGKNTLVGCHALFQGIFLTQGSNTHLLCLLHWQVGSLPLVPLESPMHNALLQNWYWVSQSRYEVLYEKTTIKYWMLTNTTFLFWQQNEKFQSTLVFQIIVSFCFMVLFSDWSLDTCQQSWGWGWVRRWNHKLKTVAPNAWNLERQSRCLSYELQFSVQAIWQLLNAE